MTQWLVEEACFVVEDTRASQQDAEAVEARERHARLTEMARRAVTG